MLIKVFLHTTAIALTITQLLNPAISQAEIKLNNSFSIAAIENVEGWRDTYWGMSYNEVKIRYPFTDEVKNPSVITDPNRYVGLTKIKINTSTFQVRFVFLKGYGLDAVALWWDKSDQESTNPIYYVTENLTTNYGKPDKESSTALPNTEFEWSKDMKWSKPKTIIDLNASEKYISLIYKRRDYRKDF